MSYRKKITMADEFMQKGDFGSAAAFYLSAYEEKPKKIEIAEKAGKAFVKIRDYKNAAAMYKVLKDDTKAYPKAQYYYALSVKQSGDYKNAITEFESFINNYRAEDFNEMNDKVANEVNGCELAIQMMNSDRKPDVEIEYLSRMVNSDEQEFAPIPFVENLLYFSSMRDGTAQIFRSERGGKGWDRPEKPQIFGSMERPHFGHGAFTPDRRAFYFTQCDMNLAGEFSCDIYIMQRMNNKWAKPVRLPDYINEENTTSTMPFVTVVDDKEILYFVSDREGGMGGTDIWYVTKEGSSTDFNFSLPVNAGMGINTTGNEVSPFYDKTAGIMYFSSDGHPGFGGLDVFRSNGSLTTWDKPQNLGKPTNSSADDKYYVKNYVLGSNKEYGYFISNRLEGTEKEYTDNDDIFYFEVNEVEVIIRGSITEFGNESKLLDNVTVDLIIIEETGDENRLATKVFNDGEYYFKLSPNREYKIEATKDGYETTSFELETNAFTGDSEFTQDLALEKVELVAVLQPEVQPEVQPEIKPVDTPPGGNREEPVTEPVTEPVRNEPPVKPPLPPVVNTDPVEQPEEQPEQPEITVVDNDARYNEEGVKLISFSNLTKEEKRDRVFFVDDVPYIRRNGELFAIEGLMEENVAQNTPQTPPGRKPTKVITEPEPIGGNGEFLPPETVEVETGEYYKIQLVAVTTYKPYKFESLKSLGAIQLESTTNSYGDEIQRVMLTPFQTLDEAKATLGRIVENPRFERAYIVKYVDGQRVKHSKIRLASFRG